ncbi:hypothetical protein J7E49_23360 [Variovorax paradoxus]|nr:hypothetical protein [Variovorax paradoxus]
MNSYVPVSPAWTDAYFRSMLDWQAACSTSVLQAQQMQWEMLAAWQQSAKAVQQELWDQWTSHFGGGVPLDG